MEGCLHYLATKNESTYISTVHWRSDWRCIGIGRATAFNKTSAHKGVLQHCVMFAHSVSNGLVPLLHYCQQEHFERQGFSLRFLHSVGQHAIVSCMCESWLAGC